MRKVSKIFELDTEQNFQLWYLEPTYIHTYIQHTYIHTYIQHTYIFPFFWNVRTKYIQISNGSSNVSKKKGKIYQETIKVLYIYK